MSLTNAIRKFNQFTRFISGLSLLYIAIQAYNHNVIVDQATIQLAALTAFGMYLMGNTQ